VPAATAVVMTQKATSNWSRTSRKKPVAKSNNQSAIKNQQFTSSKKVTISTISISSKRVQGQRKTESIATLIHVVQC